MRRGGRGGSAGKSGARRAAGGGARRSVRPAALLAELERVRAQFGGPEAAATAARKAELLGALARARLSGADAVLRLHEAACFLRAYPDDPAVLLAAERLLAGFGARADLRAVRAQLENSGVAGTDITYPFFASTDEEREAMFGPAGRTKVSAVRPSVRLAQRLAELEAAAV